MTPETRSASSPMLVALMTSLVLLTSCASSGEFLTGYVEAPASDREMIVPIIYSYYEARSELASTRDIQAFWRSYPALSDDRDPKVGINVESNFSDRMAALGIRLVKTEPEAVDPLRFFVKGDRAIVFVHGRESWIGGTVIEIYTIFYLSRAGDGWVITKTDEHLTGEPWRTPPAVRQD
jgi:hypothetical protein